MKKHAIATMLTAGGLMLGAFSAAAQGQQPCRANVPNVPAAAGSTHSEENAVVEADVTGEQDGYRYRAYIVDWRGYRVLVRDPLLRTDFPAGSNVRLLVMRHQIGARRLLDFFVVGHGQSQLQGSGAHSVPAQQRASATETSGLVEDVLSAEQDGYRFRAYVVSLQGQNVPVFDTLSLSNEAIGEQIDVLGMRLQTRDGAVADFQIRPDIRMSAQLLASQSVTTTTSEQSGVVDEVLTAQLQGYRYRAYVVQWHATRVVVPDPSAQTDYQAGDTLAFRAQQISGAGPIGDLLTFTLPGAQAGATAPPQPSSSARVNDQSQKEAAAVTDVLQAQEGASRFRAYIVTWHGAHVAVIDAFASSPVAVGQSISFSVAQTQVSGSDPSAEVKQLNFMRFDFPGCTAGSASPQ